MVQEVNYVVEEMLLFSVKVGLRTSVFKIEN